MKKFYVHYDLTFSSSIEVEAKTAEEAEVKVKDMLDAGKIGEVKDMDFAGRNVYAD